ncbi:hypothetical protein CMQ_1080 [Grosmannia clavigera kw1407]|uniref:Uncharacterized protein n=1 Tax=Grosmannia clavigera (strain kw1407 / UAMH 11150) TaxID=655863 RepID=F0XFU4_GROCL|nr:uncharacterized protein CMQ_1080 [Grosmannia clavigera kw1407]EFX04152.1 hypothetical protein CMQ_1080 [Grosmannia clavigera kw1407]
MDGDRMDIVDGRPAPDTAADGVADDSSSMKKLPASWDTPKHREESDKFKDVLADQGFNIADYGDPLSADRPIGKIYNRPFPQETEERLRSLMERLQNSST